MTSTYTSEDLPFSPEQLKTFHSFHAYNWDNDKIFKDGLSSIDQKNPTQTLKAKHFYFSRYVAPIDLDEYLRWEKYITQHGDDTPNGPDAEIFERFETYDFDRDERFLNGLPNIVAKLVKNKVPLDKEAYEREMMKAKAYYYSKMIESLDFAEYLRWHDEKNKKDAPACPYAHLWQHKVNQGSVTTPTKNSSKAFLRIIAPPAKQGALHVTLASPRTRNILTIQRLAQLSSAISRCSEDPNFTSLILSADTDTQNVPHRLDPDTPGIHYDTRVFSSGLAIDQTAAKARASTTPQYESVAIDSLARSYHHLAHNLHTLATATNKPVITIADGQVTWTGLSLVAGGSVRVITENAVLAPRDVAIAMHNPACGLAFLSQLVLRSVGSMTGQARPPHGCALYLALTAPDLYLRGPDLLKLGFAEYFVPSSRLDEVVKIVVGNAGCPAPHTASAVRVALEAEKVYAGPAKIDVWRKEVEECFDNVESIEDVFVRLNTINNNWSKAILEHLRRQSPTMLKITFKAIRDTTGLSFDDCLKLEHRIGTRWRRSDDYKAWIEAGEIQSDTSNPTWTPSTLSSISDAYVDAFFAPLTNEVGGELTFNGPAVSAPEDAVAFEPEEDAVAFEPEEDAAADEGFVDGSAEQSEGVGSKEEEDGALVTCPVTGMVGRKPESHP